MGNKQVKPVKIVHYQDIPDDIREKMLKYILPAMKTPCLCGCETPTDWKTTSGFMISGFYYYTDPNGHSCAVEIKKPVEELIKRMCVRRPFVVVQGTEYCSVAFVQQLQQPPLQAQPPHLEDIEEGPPIHVGPAEII